MKGSGSISDPKLEDGTASDDSQDPRPRKLNVFLAIPRCSNLFMRRNMYEFDAKRRGGAPILMKAFLLVLELHLIIISAGFVVQVNAFEMFFFFAMALAIILLRAFDFFAVRCFAIGKAHALAKHTKRWRICYIVMLLVILFMHFLLALEFRGALEEDRTTWGMIFFVVFLMEYLVYDFLKLGIIVARTHLK